MVKKASGKEDERMNNDFASDVRENEIDASAGRSLDEQFGRRIEANGSWTIYHVFTGIPAVIKGVAMMDLSYAVASEGMFAMNKYNNERRNKQSSPSIFRRMGWRW